MDLTIMTPLRQLVAFPPGEVVYRSDSVSHQTFSDVDRLLSAGRCTEGRLELEAHDTRLMALIYKGAPYVAGLQEGKAKSTVPLSAFVVRAQQLDHPVCRLVACDKALVLLTAVHFTKQPDLQGSLKLINPAHVLRTLVREQRDAALAFERNGRKTLLFLHRGIPARLYFGDPAEDPNEGSLEDRLLLWAFESISETGIEVFSDLTIAADPDGGNSFVRLDDETRPPPPTTVHVRMDDREIRRRPFTPPEMIIGRDPRVDIFIDNLGVSRRHARLWWERGHFMLADLGSSNGTAVNGRRIEQVPVTEGDAIMVGKFRLAIEVEAQEPQVPETHLIMTEGPRVRFWLCSDEGRRRINGDLLLGRGRGADVRVRGWQVGPIHARLSPVGGKLLLSCLNGRKVEVNGAAVAAARLDVGDDLIVGRSRFWISRDAVEQTA
jgi:hypothetical protein